MSTLTSSTAQSLPGITPFKIQSPADTNNFIDWFKSCVQLMVLLYANQFLYGIASVVLGDELYKSTFTNGAQLPPVFTPPIDAVGPRPEPGPNDSQAAIAASDRLGLSWDRAHNNFLEYTTAVQAFTQLAFQSLPVTDQSDPAISPHPILGHLMTPPDSIMKYMKKTYGTVTVAQKRANMKAMQAMWDPATTTLAEYIARLNKTFTVAEQQGLAVSTFNKVEIVRAALANAPAYLKKVADDYNHSVVDGEQVYHGPANTGLVPKLLAAAARITDDLAGSTGFAGAATPSNDVTSLRTELAELKIKLTNLEKINAKLSGTVEKKCTGCGVSFLPRLPVFSTCRECWVNPNKDAQPKANKVVGGKQDKKKEG
jgi:hypothetical protein